MDTLSENWWGPKDQKEESAGSNASKEQKGNLSLKRDNDWGGHALK